MGARWDAQLLQPITEEQPCGVSLEDSDLLSSFDTYALFGQSTPLDEPPAQGEKRVPKPFESPVWREIQDKALEGLGRSKDLRLLAFLGTSLLRTEGIQAFAEVLEIAAAWLDTNWTDTFPQIDEDAVLRRNALNCFADRMAVVEPLRRAPLVSSRQHGRFALRDVEMATGQQPAGPDETPRTEAQVNAAFQEVALEDLQRLHERLAAGVAALTRIDSKMREEGGPEAAPGFEPLSAQLAKVVRVLRAQLAARPDAVPATGEGDQAGGASPQGVPVGAIASRQDAIRALDAVSRYFRDHEPSSPVPLLIERAKRLVAKDFLEVLQDIVPDALVQARSVAGIRDE
jgi:type VI secretion system protein ImpA